MELNRKCRVNLMKHAQNDFVPCSALFSDTHRKSFSPRQGQILHSKVPFNAIVLCFIICVQKLRGKFVTKKWRHNKVEPSLTKFNMKSFRNEWLFFVHSCQESGRRGWELSHEGKIEAKLNRPQCFAYKKRKLKWIHHGYTPFWLLGERELLVSDVGELV